jgi:hypothetical protein
MSIAHSLPENLMIRVMQNATLPEYQINLRTGKINAAAVKSELANPEQSPNHRVALSLLAKQRTVNIVAVGKNARR